MNTSENSAQRGTLPAVTHGAGRCQTTIFKTFLPAVELRCTRACFHGGLQQRVTPSSEGAPVCHAEHQDVTVHIKLCSAMCRPLQAWAILILRFYCKLNLNNLGMLSCSCSSEVYLNHQDHRKLCFSWVSQFERPTNSWPISGQNKNAFSVY